MLMWNTILMADHGEITNRRRTGNPRRDHDNASENEEGSSTASLP